MLCIEYGFFINPGTKCLMSAVSRIIRAPVGSVAEKPIWCAPIAQLVEHRIRNAGVGGSNPPWGTIFFSRLLFSLVSLKAAISSPAEACHDFGTLC